GGVWKKIHEENGFGEFGDGAAFTDYTIEPEEIEIAWRQVIPDYQRVYARLPDPRMITPLLVRDPKMIGQYIRIKSIDGPDMDESVSNISKTNLIEELSHSDVHNYVAKRW